MKGRAGTSIVLLLCFRHLGRIFHTFCVGIRGKICVCLLSRIRNQYVCFPLEMDGLMSRCELASASEISCQL